MLFENHFIFFPAKHPEGDWDAPARHGVPCEDVWIDRGDGVRIHGWYLPGRGAQHTILFLHGNAGNLTGRFGWMLALTSLPANVLIIDYQGYGRSDGSPNEEALYGDAEAAYRYLVEDRGVAPERLVIYGNSLGGGVGSELALEVPAAALILQSTFTSLPDMAARQMPFIPRGLVRTKFATVDKVGRIEAPILIIHSRGDQMIPVEMARKNHAATDGRARLVELERGGHNDVTAIHTARLLTIIREFLSAGP